MTDSFRDQGPSEAMDVPAGFDRIAATYDRMVGFNPGYHRHLRLSARRLDLGEAVRPLRLLDLGCGTGASTAALLRTYPGAVIVGVDASTGMVAAARAKPWPRGVRFVHAPAEDLAAALARGGTDPGFDAVLAAYLIRNVADAEGVLAAVLDLLRPGGRLAVHEYSVADSAWARARWRAVCRGVVVPTGRLVSRSTDLYRYLERSVLDFDGIAAFERRMARAGFVDVRTLPVGGWQRGIVHTFLGQRPAASDGDVGGEFRR